MSEPGRRRFPWGHENIEEELQLCSDDLIPYIYDRCERGYYVSVPFTADFYYVLFQPNEYAGTGKYYFYRVEYNNKKEFEPVFEESDMMYIKNILKKIDEKAIKEINKYVSRKHVLEIKSLELAPDDRESVYNLVGKRSITLYPNGKVNETIRLIGELLHSRDKRGLLGGIKTQEVKIPLGEDIVRINVPVVPTFNTDLYFKTASIEIYDHGTAIPILTYLYLYNKYRVSRPVRYIGE
jgi:hypothetical protein